MKVYIKEDHPNKSGIVSSISWENPDLLRGLNTMFHVDTKNEKIKDIVIDSYGITAYVETKND